MKVRLTRDYVLIVTPENEVEHIALVAYCEKKPEALPLIEALPSHGEWNSGRAGELLDAVDEVLGFRGQIVSIVNVSERITTSALDRLEAARKSFDINAERG
jgi:hypothetical protein